MKLVDFRLRTMFSSWVQKPTQKVYSDRFIYSLLPPKRTHLWIIAAPKTGSTWLSKILENYLAWEVRSLTRSYDRREQEPSLRALAESASIDKVLWKHQHTRASKSTIDLIRQASIFPIIQTRDIHDTVISFSDHFQHESTICPMAYMDDQRWRQLDDAARTQFMVSMVAPWYFNFYAGWFASDLVRDKIAYVCRYENLMRDPCAELIKICEHFHLPVNECRAQAAVELAASQPTRLNHGVIGRGAKLTDEHRAHLSQMRSYYSGIDFSAAGFID